MTPNYINKKVFFLLAVIWLLFLANPVRANPLHASIVIDANTGEVLHASHADASRYPASLTKMMTLYMLFEAIEQRKMALDTRMQVSAHAAAMPSTNINLRSGDSISVREAIPALIVRSANDVAAAVASGADGIVMPKVESPLQLEELDADLAREEHFAQRPQQVVRLIVLIETPEGVVQAPAIARASCLARSSRPITIPCSAFTPNSDECS